MERLLPAQETTPMRRSNERYYKGQLKCRCRFHEEGEFNEGPEPRREIWGWYGASRAECWLSCSLTRRMPSGRRQVRNLMTWAFAILPNGTKMELRDDFDCGKIARGRSLGA